MCRRTCGDETSEVLIGRKYWVIALVPVFCFALAVTLIHTGNLVSEPMAPGPSAVIPVEGFSVGIEEARSLVRAEGYELLLPAYVPEGLACRAVLVGVYTTGADEKWHTDQVILVFSDKELSLGETSRSWLPILNRETSYVRIEGSQQPGTVHQLDLSLYLPPHEFWDSYSRDKARTMIIGEIDKYVAETRGRFLGSDLVSIWRDELAGWPGWVRVQKEGYVEKDNSISGFPYTGSYIRIYSPEATYTIRSVLSINETLRFANSLSSDFKISLNPSMAEEGVSPLFVTEAYIEFRDQSTQNKFGVCGIGRLESLQIQDAIWTHVLVGFDSSNFAEVGTVRRKVLLWYSQTSYYSYTDNGVLSTSYGNNIDNQFHTFAINNVVGAFKTWVFYRDGAEVGRHTFNTMSYGKFVLSQLESTHDSVPGNPNTEVSHWKNLVWLADDRYYYAWYNSLLQELPGWAFSNVDGYKVSNTEYYTKIVS